MWIAVVCDCDWVSTAPQTTTHNRCVQLLTLMTVLDTNPHKHKPNSSFTMSGSDFSLTTFSPSGKLVQIEYALKAVEGGKTALG